MLISTILSLGLIAAACGDPSPTASAESAPSGTWSITAVDDVEPCSAISGVGELEALLFDACDGAVEWQRSGDVVEGGCADSRYPTLPSTAANPNPDSLKIRVAIRDACAHPQLADAAGCFADSLELQSLAESSLAIEYRDGLFPWLPDGSTYCGLIARPSE